MNWIFYALLSPALYTAVTFVDKHLVSNVVKDYKSLPIYSSIVGFVAGLLFWIITGFPFLSARDGLIVIATGVITSWSMFLYFKALENEQTSNINILFQMYPVLSLILAYLFLGETITQRQFLGFLLILAAAVGVSIQPRKRGEKILSKAFFLILVFSFMSAVSSVLIKFAIDTTSFSEVLSFESFGIALGGLSVFLLFPSIRRGFLKNAKSIKNKTLKILFVNEGFFVLAKSLGFYALVLGPVALVTVLSGTQAFFGIIFGYILTKLFPKLYKEDVSSGGIIKKMGFAVLIVVGIALLV
jgi:bacterial/archaeal transporter family protein